MIRRFGKAELEVGLMMNMNRIMSTRIICDASAIGIAFNPESASDLLRSAGMSEKGIAKMEIAAWRSEATQSAKNRMGGV